jgi:hypothetical protein
MGRLKELVNVKECGKYNDHCCKGLVGLLMLSAQQNPSTIHET